MCVGQQVAIPGNVLGNWSLYQAMCWASGRYTRQCVGQLVAIPGNV